MANQEDDVKDQQSKYMVLLKGTYDDHHLYELQECNTKRVSGQLQTASLNISKRKSSSPIFCQLGLLCLIMLLLTVTLAIAGMILARIEAQSTVSSGTTASAAQNLNLQNCPTFTDMNQRIFNITQDSALKLKTVVNSVLSMKETSISSAGVVDDILLIIQKLMQLHNDSFSLPFSCKEVKTRQPYSPSGVYLLATTSNRTQNTYCHMEKLCGSGGGWTRIAYLDMTDPTEDCPSGFKLYQSGGVRACGRLNPETESCASVQFPSNGISYSQVCGRVLGYQYIKGSHKYKKSNLNRDNLNANYINGVSITHGLPRHHIWTLMAGLENAKKSRTRKTKRTKRCKRNEYNCPCGSAGNDNIQTFIGKNYFCESGDLDWEDGLNTLNPLWDGNGCNSCEEDCCAVPNLPWFHRDYGGTTTNDFLELRVCSTTDTKRDVPVRYVEIYVQ